MAAVLLHSPYRKDGFTTTLMIRMRLSRVALGKGLLPDQRAAALSRSDLAQANRVHGASFESQIGTAHLEQFFKTTPILAMLFTKVLSPAPLVTRRIRRILIPRIGEQKIPFGSRRAWWIQAGRSQVIRFLRI